MSPSLSSFIPRRKKLVLAVVVPVTLFGGLAVASFQLP